MKSVENKKAKISKLSLLILALLISAKIFLSPLGGLDELWNYNLCRGVAMGYVPYRDFSMVMMPLFTLIFSLPLMIVRKLIVYRMTSVVFLFIVTMLFYKTAAEVTDPLWGLTASCLFIAFMDIATYNGLLFLFAVILYRIFCKEMTRGRAFASGVLCALAILARQTTGVFLTITVIVLAFVLKDIRKHLPILIGGGATVLVAFLIYLLATRSFWQFWDCCLFALLQPGETNSAFYANSILAMVICIVGIVFDVKLWRCSKDRKDLLHLIFGVMIITIGVPTIDMMHLCYGAVWFILPLLKALLSSKRSKDITPSVIKLITGLTVCTVLILCVYGMLGTSLDESYGELILIPSPEGFLDSYTGIVEKNDACRSSGSKVAVYSCSSCVISILEGGFNPPYDLFLKGNLGTAHPLSFVEADCADEDTIILMPLDYDTENWENPSGVYEYITSHCEPVDSYGRFVWYRPVS